MIFTSVLLLCLFFFSSRRRHTRSLRDWSSDVCSSDLPLAEHVRRADEREAVGLRRARRHRLEVRDLVVERRVSEAPRARDRLVDRKSTRLNSSHVESSYAVFCLKKKTRKTRSHPGPTQ